MTVALWFHSLAVLGSILPLAFGYPSPPVVPTVREWSLLLAIAAFSFVNQICLNRGFQLEVAAKASAVNYTQVCPTSCLKPGASWHMTACCSLQAHRAEQGLVLHPLHDSQLLGPNMVHFSCWDVQVIMQRWHHMATCLLCKGLGHLCNQINEWLCEHCM